MDPRNSTEDALPGTHTLKVKTSRVCEGFRGYRVSLEGPTDFEHVHIENQYLRQGLSLWLASSHYSYVLFFPQRTQNVKLLIYVHISSTLSPALLQPSISHPEITHFLEVGD